MSKAFVQTLLSDCVQSAQCPRLCNMNRSWETNIADWSSPQSEIDFSLSTSQIRPCICCKKPFYPLTSSLSGGINKTRIENQITKQLVRCCTGKRIFRWHWSDFYRGETNPATEDNFSTEHTCRRTQGTLLSHRIINSPRHEWQS